MLKKCDGRRDGRTNEKTNKRTDKLIYIELRYAQLIIKTICPKNLYFRHGGDSGVQVGGRSVV